MKLKPSLFATCILAVGLSAIGCGGNGTPGSASGPACAASSNATEQSLSFSTSSGTYGIEATTRADEKGTSSTTTYTIHNGEALVLSRAMTVSKGVTTTEMDYGAVVQGARRVVLVNDGTALSGSIDGRAIVPVSLGEPHVIGGIEMADGQAAPTATVPDEVHHAIETLLDAATTSIPSSCQGAPAAAVSALTGALGYEHGASLAPKTAPQADVGTSQAALTYAPEGVPSGGGSGTSIQNNPIQYMTPHCISCQHDCFSNVALWLTLGGEELCAVGCLIPFAGGCAQQFCADFGTCDSDQTCCGSQCCGPNGTCGNSATGTCCPKDHPVGCGDRTKVTCFAAGSTCCGTQDVACGPGQVCGNTAGAPTCCAAAKLSKSGQCCDKPTCGGQCCDQGACLPNGTCCFGPVAANNTCCGITDSVCNGQCCAGSCTSTGACCAGTVCGSACCGQDQVCLNAGSSTCGAPTQPVLLFEDANGNVLHIMEAIEGSTYQIVGEGFVAGTVNVSLASGAGTTSLGTATVGSNGKFSVTHVFQPVEGGGDVVTATEGSLQATLNLTVIPVP